MCETKLSKAEKLELARSLSDEDQEAINTILNGVDFVHTKAEGWKVSIHGDGKMPFTIHRPQLVALLAIGKLLESLNSKPPSPSQRNRSSGNPDSTVPFIALWTKILAEFEEVRQRLIEDRQSGAATYELEQWLAEGALGISAHNLPAFLAADTPRKMAALIQALLASAED
jgi:hypothetical protein